MSARETICKAADVLDDELERCRLAVLVLLANAVPPSAKDGMGTHLEPLIDLAQALSDLGAEVHALRNFGEQQPRSNADG